MLHLQLQIIRTLRKTTELQLFSHYALVKITIYYKTFSINVPITYLDCKETRIKYKQCRSLLYSEQMLVAKRELQKTQDSLQQEATDHRATKASLHQEATDHQTTQTSLQKELTAHTKTKASLQHTSAELQKTKGESSCNYNETDNVFTNK